MKNSLRTPVIHIGMPKTATTTLQSRLFSEHSEIFYLGRFDGRDYAKNYRKFDFCRDVSVQSLMNQICYGDVFSPDFKKCKILLQDILTPALRKNLLPVWSWESYSTDISAKRRVRARNLKMVFGDAKIIMTIRHPVALLESAYFQQLKRDNVGSNGRCGKSVYYRPIDDWLKENFNGEIMPHLQYAETIQMYIDQFGQDNVLVFLFEELLADQEKFLKKMCAIIGINAEETLSLVKKRVENSRWTKEQLTILNCIVSSYSKALLFKYSSKNIRKRTLKLDDNGVPLNPGEKAHAAISRPWQEKILQTTRDGDLWLQEKLNLPLTQYGYSNFQRMI